MSLQSYSLGQTLAEPKPESYRDQSADEDHSALRHQNDRLWLRAQLLAGKSSPLCDPISPTHFDDLRARIKQSFANK